MSVSIKDIAKISGVSTATVSRALSDPTRVSEKTRQAIMEVVEKHGYRVNSHARSLRRQRADAILALLPDLGNPFFSVILSGIELELQDHGMDLLVADSRATERTGRSVFNHLHASRVDGVICLDGTPTDAARAELAEPDVAERVVFACEWMAEGDFPYVRSDNRGGGALAVDHLVGLGHRDIAFLRGPVDNILTEEREAGVREALAKHGLGLSDTRVGGNDFTLEAGFEAAEWIAGLSPRPTAVICTSDQIAIGLMSGLRERGLSVPDDVSVVGFDDIASAAYVTPSLTTIRQDRIGLGRAAAQVMLKRIGVGKAPEACVCTLPVSLMTRHSTAAPKA
ncbi:LacI family DNA-binding transcriptional regulator [Donghicola mangrovi]|uniref:LacI family transcriptional regulator n=1 Tax=Donghicola mangrovi TaxID=2729614 RepID=A0A850Q7Y7_9RHOB|nr:LacI family DNA-binding transcriptional regulator [Donghicola mangrovi]NVO25024.1 LacI family transcriptional regulator [Donghicola mangrovi]